MKFIHFADAHLDSPFLGLSFLPSRSSSSIHDAPNQSLTKVVDLALQENVDLVLIAGDTFDSARPNPSSQIFFAQQIARLTDAKIQVVMIFGNHDHMKKEDLLISASPYFKLLGDGETVETVSYQTANGFEYEVTGFSYLKNHITTNKISEFPAKGRHYTFGLMHAQEKSGQSSQNVYAPFNLTELKELNYDYFALGHIHLRQVLSTTPWIVYPGNLQGRHINETGEKGCYLGEINEQTKETKIQFIPTCPIVWQKVAIKLQKPLSQADLQTLICDNLTSSVTTYYCLKIIGAEYLSAKEREMIQESDFWHMISQQLDCESQLVDVRLASNSHLEIAENDQVYFKQAEKEVFDQQEFRSFSNDWAKKDDFAAELAQSALFEEQVQQLAEVKLNSKLKGISDEINED